MSKTGEITAEAEVSDVRITVHDDLEKLPFKCEEILRDAVKPIDRSSLDNLLAQLYAGVLLDQKTKIYWVDQKSNKNCFMLYPRDLYVIDHKELWKWQPLKDKISDEFIEVIELRQELCWLKVEARFDVTRLSPNTWYIVSFEVMMLNGAYGWNCNWVNMRLTLPDGIRHEHKVNFAALPSEKWVDIPVGVIQTSIIVDGVIVVSLYETDTGLWKNGLVIKGVKIEPY